MENLVGVHEKAWNIIKGSERGMFRFSVMQEDGSLKWDDSYENHSLSVIGQIRYSTTILYSDRPQYEMTQGAILFYDGIEYDPEVIRAAEQRYGVLEWSEQGN